MYKLLSGKHIAPVDDEDDGEDDDQPSERAEKRVEKKRQKEEKAKKAEAKKAKREEDKAERQAQKAADKEKKDAKKAADKAARRAKTAADKADQVAQAKAEKELKAAEKKAAKEAKATKENMTKEDGNTAKAPKKKGQKYAQVQSGSANTSGNPDGNGMDIDPTSANPSSGSLDMDHSPPNKDNQTTQPEDDGSTDADKGDESMEDLNDVEKTTQFQPCEYICLNYLSCHSSFPPAASSPDLTHLLNAEVSSQHRMEVDSEGDGDAMLGVERKFISTAFNFNLLTKFDFVQLHRQTLVPHPVYLSRHKRRRVSGVC